MVSIAEHLRIAGTYIVPHALYLFLTILNILDYLQYYCIYSTKSVRPSFFFK